MNKALRVKKLWSWNPTKYKSITLDEASKKYARYLRNHAVSFNKHVDSDGYTEPKSFIDWLQSEI